MSMQLIVLLKRTLPSFSVLHLFLRRSKMPALVSGVKDSLKLSFAVMKFSRRFPVGLPGLKHSVMSKLLGMMCSSYFRPWLFTQAITSLDERYSVMGWTQRSFLYVFHRVSQPPSAGQQEIYKSIKRKERVFFFYK